MGIGSLENTQKMASNRDLITAIKKVFYDKELKHIIECLKELKKAKELDIAGALKNLKFAIFKDQENPKETDKAYAGKK